MQSRTRLQGRWNGIFSLECRAGLDYKAGGMDLEQNWITRHVKRKFHGVSHRIGQRMQVEWNFPWGVARTG